MFNYIKSRNENGDVMSLNIVKIVTHSIIVLAVLVLFFSSYLTIGAGQRGVVLTFGAFNNQVFEPGLHFKLPFIQRVIKY